MKLHMFSAASVQYNTKEGQADIPDRYMSSLCCGMRCRCQCLGSVVMSYVCIAHISNNVYVCQILSASFWFQLFLCCSCSFDVAVVMLSRCCYCGYVAAVLLLLPWCRCCHGVAVATAAAAGAVAGAAAAVAVFGELAHRNGCYVKKILSFAKVDFSISILPDPKIW